MQHHRSDLVAIPVPTTDTTIMAVNIDGVPHVSLRHACDTIGIDSRSQIRKLNRTSWACVVMKTLQVGDQRREVAMIDRRTFTMWLATIDTSRIDEAARPIIEAFQSQAADALDAYFNEGGAINPAATEDQLNRLARQAQAQAGVLQALRGIVDAKHLEAKGRIILARALGEEPEIDAESVPLYVSDFLKEMGLNSDLISAKASGFGRRLKGLYLAEHGEVPGKAFQNLPNGTTREVYAYTQADRPLFEQVWNRHYEGVVAA